MHLPRRGGVVVVVGAARRGEVGGTLNNRLNVHGTCGLEMHWKAVMDSDWSIQSINKITTPEVELNYLTTRQQ